MSGVIKLDDKTIFADKVVAVIDRCAPFGEGENAGIELACDVVLEGGVTIRIAETADRVADLVADAKKGGAK